MKTYIKRVIIFLYAALVVYESSAQDLEPRAYVRIPVNINLIGAGVSFSKGGVVTDPSIPLTDLKATLGTGILNYVHSFSLFGLTSQALAVLPYSSGKASALVSGQSQSRYFSGIGDMRFRISVLLFGAPALSMREFAKATPKTVIGTSLTIIAPTGQYYSDKLINIGASRWAFKPEVALSQPLGKRWLLDLYAGVWFYTVNNSFYPGNTIKTQEPIATFQGHISYNLSTIAWAAFDVTYYGGGSSTQNGIRKNDEISNVRYGFTLALPTGKRSSLKIAFSEGAYILAGADFYTVSVGWAYLWN
jgi:Putative MetA-pathway of phenol degradation